MSIAPEVARRFWLGLNTALFASLFIVLVWDFTSFYPAGANLLTELLANLLAGSLIGAYFLRRAIQTQGLSRPTGLLHAALAWMGLFVAHTAIFIAVLAGVF